MTKVVFMSLFLLSVAVVSLSGVMMPGPVFAVTLARSYKSQFAGMRVALGHALVEIPLMLLIYFGFASFFQEALVQKVLYLVGGAVLVWLGIGTFRARGKVVGEGRELPHKSVIAGAVTSALNPFFVLWWATIGSMLIMKSLSFGLIGFILFAVVHLLCDFGWLSFVSVLGHRTKSLWGGRFREGLFIASGALLIGFGGWFLSSGFQVTV